MLLDLGVVPLLALSLAISAAALLAKARYYWYDRERTLFTKISFSVFVLSLVFAIGWFDWYLMRRFVAAVTSVL